jgi:hypothetical protein
VSDLQEKLEKKETYMQTKEKRWLEVEKIIDEYSKNDFELTAKLEAAKMVT